ncbi:MFS transporter [Paenibacillus marinisediminis]
MNIRVFILAIAAFVVGMVELIVGGILNLIAEDLNITVSSAGLFITIFSISFAVTGPIIMNLTSRMDRKRLYLYALALFLLSNLLVAFTSSYMLILSARALSAMSGSVIVVLSITMAAQLVPASHKGRAIGIIYMGISGSLVLGVPIGMVIGNAYGWRAPFLVIAFLSLLAMIGIAVMLKPTAPNPVVPLRKQLATLKDKKIISAQLIGLLMLTGHLTLYAYLTPYVEATFSITPSMMSVVYFLFGIAAVLGGGIGGWVSDRWGAARSIIVIVTCFSMSMFSLMLASQASFYVFLVFMMLWGALSWSLSPAMQTYLMKIAPDTADIQLSLNSSMMHLGIAGGSLIGSVVIKQSSVANNPWVGGLIALTALGCAAYSLSRRSAGSIIEPGAEAFVAGSAPGVGTRASGAESEPGVCTRATGGKSVGPVSVPK